MAQIWTPAEDKIITDVYAAGRPGWVTRALPLLPGRTKTGIRFRGWQIRNGKAKSTETVLAERIKAGPKPIPCTPKKTFKNAQKIPDFLRDDFAKWAARG
jgi:hypothetical protein